MHQHSDIQKHIEVKKSHWAQGERDTNELNNKLAQFSENAMKFTMDGGLSAYDYKAEDEDMDNDVNFKALAGAFSPSRQRSPLITMPVIFSPYLLAKRSWPCLVLQLTLTSAGMPTTCVCFCMPCHYLHVFAGRT